MRTNLDGFYNVLHPVMMPMIRRRAACVDACNSVMDKVERPRGLIRYSTDHAMENNFNSKQIRQRAMRPRVLIYTSILGLIIIAVCTSLLLRMIHHKTKRL